MLRIEVDGHFHGGKPIKPWVAEIGKPSPRYGLERTFLDPMNDYRHARRAWSGNLYGKIATFPLREGRLYEVARCRGRSSKRYFAREFYLIEDRKMVERTPEEALAHADGGGAAAPLRVRESADSWVAAVTGLGTPSRLGYVLVDGVRRYRLRDGVHEVVEDGQRRLVGVRDGAILNLSDHEAMAWLAR
jgi:hypothetical protein